MMYLTKLGDTAVYRPREVHVHRFNKEVVAHLGTRRWDGFTADSERVNEAVQFLFHFCDLALRESLPKLASRDFYSFLLAQSDAWETTRAASNAGRLTEWENDIWVRSGVSAKRAIHHLLEQIVALSPGESMAADERDRVWLIDRAMIAAEWSFQLSQSSAFAHSVCPRKVELRIQLDSLDDYFSVQFESSFRKRMDSYLNRRSRSLPPRYNELLNLDADEVLVELDPVFHSEHGLTLSQVIGAGRVAHACSLRSETEGFDVRFVLRDSMLSGTALEIGTDRETLEPLFNAFVLTPSAVAERALWKPKQEPRILRRPYAEMPHERGVHYSWVGSLVKNALEVRIQDLAFGRCPPEWESVVLRNAITKFTQRLDRAWERTVEDELVNRGFRAIRSLKAIDGLRLDQNGRPGEIDILLFDEADGSLVVAETKRTQPTYDAAYWRAELDEYVRKKESYVTKHRKKVTWVGENWEAVCRELLTRGTIDRLPETKPRVRAVMITKYPSIASVAVDDWPIFCLAWLLQDFDKSGAWPF